MESYTSSCFDCRYPLDGIASSDCPECGRPFDLLDAATFNRVLGDPVKITERSLANAVMLRLHLEQEGIPTAMVQQAGGLIMYHTIPMAELYVNRADKNVAHEIMAEYDTTEHAAPIDDEQWTCPGCGEDVDAQFGACWNCGAERESD